jgi:hypothetical protein
MRHFLIISLACVSFWPAAASAESPQTIPTTVGPACGVVEPGTTVQFTADARDAASRSRRGSACSWPLPGTDGSSHSAIQGLAINSGNRPLPNSVVQLRDAEFGQIVGTQVTTDSGAFSFGGLEAGHYVAELLGDRQGVIATSDIMAVGAGEQFCAILRMPHLGALAGALDRSTGVLAVTAAAAAAGVLGTAVTTDDASPRFPPQ